MDCKKVERCWLLTDTDSLVLLPLILVIMMSLDEELFTNALRSTSASDHCIPSISEIFDFESKLILLMATFRALRTRFFSFVFIWIDPATSLPVSPYTSAFSISIVIAFDLNQPFLNFKCRTDRRIWARRSDCRRSWLDNDISAFSNFNSAPSLK